MSAFAPWDKVLATLADTPEEFIRDKGRVCLTRMGQEREFDIAERAGVGVAVSDKGKWTPIAAYIQRELLQMPRLASQITKVLERREKDEKRPVHFIDGPSRTLVGDQEKQCDYTAVHLAQLFAGHEVGVTHIVQLMAHAGGGKTSLLEHLAREHAKRYVPDAHPLPLVLHVDLLGRYVGSIEDAIAGSLNNTYSFAGLFQRQLVTAMQQNWIVLALDGFDELVARVGVRDAFNKLRELVEQLDREGCVVISARAGFFHMREVEAGISSQLHCQ